MLGRLFNLNSFHVSSLVISRSSHQFNNFLYIKKINFKHFLLQSSFQTVKRLNSSLVIIGTLYLVLVLFQIFLI
jgi:hypothetical protein